ncbi:MAG: SIR2 family protein [Saprospiraceae bacterium]|nr:SIR2 family protein [Saprospiraceae bacterium]
METFIWDDILDDIAEQRAVLLLGHNFLPGAQEQLHTALTEKLGDKLQHFYSRDGLFLFRDSDTKTTAQQVAARFYRNNAPDDAMLKKIAEMPFRLMISANPDKFLLDAFAQYKLRLQFDYFSSNNKEQDAKVERPTEENPLLYNLCGSVEDQESLILDYDDLFKMLKTLLADLKIPNELRLPLMKTTTYIFVGFHFERWYTQLFLRYLNMNDNQFSNNSRNYVLKTTFQDADMERFFLQQFNIRYIGADWTFFEELHRRFEEKYPVKMRRLIDELSPTAATVAQLVARGEDESAISMLNIFKGQLPADDQEQLVMTEAAYNQYLADKKAGTALTEHLNVNLAKVRKNLLDLAKKIA